MNKRLKVLKVIIRLSLYIIMATPASVSLGLMTSLELTTVKAICFIITYFYGISFSWVSTEKFTNWLFKGVE